MKLENLRIKHPRLIYRSFSSHVEGSSLLIEFDFLLEPDISFRPRISLPRPRELKPETLGTFIFHLGMVELISYWKAACPPRILVEAGSLDAEQILWWKDLYLHGLGEFFAVNEIDFTAVDFLEIESVPNKSLAVDNESLPPADLILVGGGKDSVVTLELLHLIPRKKSPLILNPHRSCLDSARIARYTHPFVINRRLDPKLLELNAEGYLNGHTPFSAYLCFVSALAAKLFAYNRIIASNEWSAEEPNTYLYGLPVNHQYSKSLRFEERFRGYSARYLSPHIEYFSFLRPLLDLQIAKLFSSFAEHLVSFRSCNVGQKDDRWCGACPKCAFTYLCLLPFLEDHQLEQVFGTSPARSPQMLNHFRALTGLDRQKPYDCVGTLEESSAAVLLGLEKYSGQDPPRYLLELSQELEQQNLAPSSYDDVLFAWNSNHFLPPEYEAVLRNAVERIILNAS